MSRSNGTEMRAALIAQLRIEAEFRRVRMLQNLIVAALVLVGAVAATIASWTLWVFLFSGRPPSAAQQEVVGPLLINEAALLVVAVPLLTSALLRVQPELDHLELEALLREALCREALQDEDGRDEVAVG